MIDFEVIPENTYTFRVNEPLESVEVVPAIVSMQGPRITYQTIFRFKQVTNVFDFTVARPSGKNNPMEYIDIEALRNRYLRIDKVKELVEYISNNLDSFLLPPVSAVTPAALSFKPYNLQEIIDTMGPDYDLVKNPSLTVEVLNKFNGYLQGHLILKESDFNLEILDGNHRVAAIHQLISMGKEYKSLRIGVQIFIENDFSRQRQAFVDMNTSTPIDKTILTLFSNKDPLALAAKQTIGKNPEYQITEFISSSPDYIGFDAVNDSVTRNSPAVLSLNMVKNMLVKFSLGETGTAKKFGALAASLSENDYDKLLKDFKHYMKAVINFVEPFDLIKKQGISSIPELREKYISLTGAGLYIIASIGFIARCKKCSLEHTAAKLAELNWQREIDIAGAKQVNSLFRTGILNDAGKVSNTRNALQATLDTISKKIGL